MFAAELFSDVQPLVQSALDGYNISLFAYGQTHSGKTHTMVVLSVFRCVCWLLSYSFIKKYIFESGSRIQCWYKIEIPILWVYLIIYAWS